MADSNANKTRTPRWWSGGVCAALAVTATHPLDLIKVQLQTQSGAERKSVSEIMANIYRQGGFLGFYNGISASWFRQLTYTTSRFALYEWGKQFVDSSHVSSKVGLAIFAGIFGGIVGVPGDVVTVRMQNDAKMPPESRRNTSLTASIESRKRRALPVSSGDQCRLLRGPLS
ncbi:mitochondrial dicarboxylate carrier isoform X2 [Drosophila bipectinata]|uniref:mitochondrial dicarboxylate carrier isoform X2 n=1 Tax=Drosophila bipectinata TaxID=42026 RepID=UPI001C8ABF5A|nr:mitochondrial dicarboxylate carrier isoform X2 [Drosophila bipectinata]